MKLAKEIDEPDKLRIEGESVDATEKNSDGNKGPDEVFDEGEDTDERVKTPHTEMCEKSKVTEGHDVERVIVPQSDETADILQLAPLVHEVQGYNPRRGDEFYTASQ